MTEESNSEELHNPNKKPVEQRSKISKFWLGIKSLLPFLLAHHPECGDFDNHTIRVGKYGLCIGCFVGYPTGIITYYLIGLFQLNLIITPLMFLYLGIIFLASFIMSPLHLTEKKSIKIFQKIVIGIGSAFLLWYLIQLPNPPIINFFIILYVFSLIIGILNLHHVYSFLSACKKCEFLFDWGKCPGFEKVRENFESIGVPNVFKELESFSERIRKNREKK